MRLKFAWHGFEHAFSRETQAAIRSPVFHWLSWLFPLMLFTLVSANFSEGTLMDLPVSVVDNDRSPVSRQIIRDLNAGPHADVKAIDNNLNTSLKRLASAQDYALLYVPTNFEADALQGAST